MHCCRCRFRRKTIRFFIIYFIFVKVSTHNANFGRATAPISAAEELLFMLIGSQDISCRLLLFYHNTDLFRMMVLWLTSILKWKPEICAWHFYLYYVPVAMCQASIWRVQTSSCAPEMWIGSCVNKVISSPLMFRWWTHRGWYFPLWRRDMETFFAILALCVGNPPTIGDPR